MDKGLIQTRQKNHCSVLRGSLNWKNVPAWINEFDNCKLPYFTGHVICKEIKVSDPRNFTNNSVQANCLVWKVHDLENAYVEITPIDGCLYLEIHQIGLVAQAGKDYGDVSIERGYVDAAGIIELNPKNPKEYREIIDLWLPDYTFNGNGNPVTVNPTYKVNFAKTYKRAEVSMTFIGEPYWANESYVDHFGNVTIRYPKHWPQIEDLAFTNSSKIKADNWWTYHDMITINLQAYFRKILGIPLSQGQLKRFP